jgi:inner membrane protein
VLPQSHVAYSWLALTLAQDTLDVAHDTDYRVVALAAMASDLVDKPLAAAYFYRKQRAAVLFGHTLLTYLGIAYWTARRFPHNGVIGLTMLGHALLDRIWFFPDTFYWPLRGWTFHRWRKQGGEQGDMGNAYWVTFTRRRELWMWEVGGLLALAWVVWRHRLYRPRRLLQFLLTGRPG